MLDIVQSFFHNKTSWELLAVFLSVAYLVLAIRENIWCWPAAFVSTLIYTWLFWHVSLVMDSALNVYYMLMSVYGFYLWRSIADDDKHETVVEIISWPINYHLYTILLIISLSIISGSILQQNTGAAWPYLDSFTTWASVITTYMVAKKILENWLYWVFIDVVAMALYIERGLYPTAMLFAIYLVMAVVGYITWRKSMVYTHYAVAD